MLKALTFEMDLSERGINQKALIKGGARKFSAKSACPSPLRALKRFRAATYSRAIIQWRRENSPRRRIIKKERKVACSHENYLLRGA